MKQVHDEEENSKEQLSDVFKLVFSFILCYAYFS